MPDTPAFTRTSFGTLIAATARAWRRAVDRRLSPYGLSEATWLPLVRIARAPEPMRQKDLAASLALDGSAVVRLLDSLQAAGLVERREQDDDRRAKAIFLTPAGEELVGRVEAGARLVREEAFAGLDEADLAATERVLRRICDVLAAEERG